ncbi:MAG: hypothetical protein HQK66_11345, partial [Desulfamplus sp.]|nr:hypothetical protein [Desulfamplus sp.]
SNRVQAQGYPAFSGENLAINMSTGPLDITQDTAAYHHEILFVDKDYPDRGHRVNMLQASHAEAGVAMARGDYQASTYWPNAVDSTTNFGRGEFSSYVCGVIYDDKNGNDFYDVGEGISHATVTILETGEGVRGFSAGAYSIGTNYLGSVTVEAYLCDYSDPVSKIVQIEGKNVKVDFMLSEFKDLSPVMPGDDDPRDDNTGDNPPDDNTGDNPPDDNTGDNPPDDNTGDNPPDDNTGDNPPPVNGGCEELFPGKFLLPQTALEIGAGPVTVKTGISPFQTHGTLEITADFPCYTKEVDIYVALMTPDGNLYFLMNDGWVTNYFHYLYINVNGKKGQTFTFSGLPRAWYGLYWLVVPASGGNSGAINFNGPMELGYYPFTIN